MPSIPSSWSWWTVELERYDDRRVRWESRRATVRAPNRRSARNRAALIYSPWNWRPRGVARQVKEAS